MKGNNKHHMSYFDNEQNCIKAILEIHNDGNDIELDPMFFKGNFYKNGVNRPKICYDINTQVDFCLQGNAENLPIDSNSIQCMVLDPPFMICTRQSQMGYYSSKTHSFYKSELDLENGYKAIIKEANRVLKKNGILIFKCQDYTDSKTLMTHCLVYKWANELGFYAKDLAILNIPQSKVFNSNTTQRHLRKTHCYFWVFKKVCK